MKSGHLEMFLRDGTIRLGTLYEFRDEEMHGNAVGDAGEGKNTQALTAVDTEEFDLLSNDERAVFARKVFKGWDEFPDGTNLTIRMMPNSRLELYENSPDLYTFCSSLKFSESDMARMGYDSCLHIKDIDMFFYEITKSIASFVKGMTGNAVMYSDRVRPYDSEAEVPPAFIKPRAYEYQTEFRAVWSPSKEEEIKPVIIKCPDARNYCEKYKG